MMQIPIQVDAQGKILLGMLHLPRRRKQGSPLVMLNFGLNGDRVDNHRLSVLFAKRAVEAGFCVLRFDYAGCGLSDGEFHKVSLASKAADTVSMLLFTTSCFVDEECSIMLLGYSDGIRVIDYVLRKYSGINAVVAWNPVVRSMSSTFKSSIKRKIAVDPTTKKLVYPLFGVYMGLDYLREANEDMALEEFISRPLPKLFVFGTGDFQKQARQLSEEDPLLEYLEIEDANHLFSRDKWSKEVVEKTISWMVKVSL